MGGLRKTSAAVQMADGMLDALPALTGILTLSEDAPTGTAVASRNTPTAYSRYFVLCSLTPEHIGADLSLCCWNCWHTDQSTQGTA